MDTNHFLKNISRKTLIIICSVIGVLIIFRLFLPTIVLHYVNKQLSQLEEYYGHVDDIDIRLWRGAYVIDEIEIRKKEKLENDVKDTIPFFTAKEVDLSVQWRALFEGKVVAEIIVEKPTLNFVQGAHKDEDVKADTADFRELIDDLVPLTINHFTINDAQIHYIDPNSSPKVDIFITELYVVAEDLTTNPEPNDTLPASVHAYGKTYGGRFDFSARLDALADNPTFDMNAEISKLDMVGLNDFLRAYGNFDVKKGEFNLYTEFAAKEGRFGGYVKPLMKDLDIVQWEKEEGNFPQILWETIVAGGAELIQNQKEDQVATKVTIENTFENPDIGVWGAVSYVLRNAFLQALYPAIDNTIDINDLENEKKGFFQRLFSKKEGKETGKEGEPRKLSAATN